MGSTLKMYLGGMVQMTAAALKVCIWPFTFACTPLTRPSSMITSCTGASRSTLPPCASSVRSMAWGMAMQPGSSAVATEPVIRFMRMGRAMAM